MLRAPVVVAGGLGCSPKPFPLPTLQGRPVLYDAARKSYPMLTLFASAEDKEIL